MTEEPNSRTGSGKEARGSEDERESGCDSVDPLRDANMTELSASALIMRDGANRCNMGYENARESWSGDGGRERERDGGRERSHRGREYGRG